MLALMAIRPVDSRKTMWGIKMSDSSARERVRVHLIAHFVLSKQQGEALPSSIYLYLSVPQSQ